MKLTEMQICANETLTYFMQTMPNVPFTKNDIIFAYVKKSEMAKRAKELCIQCCPDKILNDSQCQQLNQSIAANALIGKEKSAVLIRVNSTLGRKDFRRIIFHELMHIFCAKLEMDTEHFIDVYGSGTTPDCDPEDELYDGLIVSGYKVWNEFIAQYYAIKMIDCRKYEYSEVAEYISYLLQEVSGSDIEGSKGAFSMICAYWFNCTDLEETLNSIDKPDTFVSNEEIYQVEVRRTLSKCMYYIYDQMQTEMPWKISESFIYELGDKFNAFRTMNSLYLSQMTDAVHHDFSDFD